MSDMESIPEDMKKALQDVAKRVFDSSLPMIKEILERKGGVCQQAAALIVERGAFLIEFALTQSVAAKYEPSCKKGCSYCCTGIPVGVTAAEAVAIISYIKKFPKDKQRKIEKLVNKNAKKMQGFSTAEQMVNEFITCAFLEEGDCSVYKKRPLSCRSYFSNDVDACREGDIAPTNLFLRAIRSAYQLAISVAASEKITLLELHSVVSSLLLDRPDLCVEINPE